MIILRILGYLLAAIVALIAAGAAFVYISAQRQLTARYDNPVANVTVARTADQTARGQYLVSTFGGCIGCHASNPAATQPVLDGSYMADIAPLGDFHPPNLTPGGRLKDWSDGEIVRAIREGIDKDGRPL